MWHGFNGCKSDGKNHARRCHLSLSFSLSISPHSDLNGFARPAESNEQEKNRKKLFSRRKRWRIDFIRLCRDFYRQCPSYPFGVCVWTRCHCCYTTIFSDFFFLSHAQTHTHMHHPFALTRVHFCLCWFVFFSFASNFYPAVVVCSQHQRCGGQSPDLHIKFNVERM